MGVRGEIFSSRVMLPNRTYFFNVKENRMGDLYLNIVESKNRETGGFDRQSVVLFADDLQEFLKGFDESLRVMEKAVREKKRSGGGDSKRDERPGRRDKPRQHPPGERPARNRRPERSANHRPDRGSNHKPERGTNHRSDYRPEKGRRVVVKKHER